MDGYTKLSKLVSLLAEIKIRLDRGNSLVYWFRNIIIIVAGIKFIIELNVLLSIIAGITLIFIMYCLGYLDLKYLRFYQAEAELLTGKYNPYFKKKLG